MTHAVCLFCGSMKFGCLVPCPECRAVPQSEMDMTYAFVCSDHYVELDDLQLIGRDIKEGKGIPRLPPDQEAKFMEAYGRFGRNEA